MAMPRLIEVIEAEATRGKGVEDDPYRTVVQYWTLDGKALLAERDPFPTCYGDARLGTRTPQSPGYISYNDEPREPTAEHWRQAMGEFEDSRTGDNNEYIGVYLSDENIAWIEQCARELAGK